MCRIGIYIHIVLSCVGYKGMDAFLEAIGLVCKSGIKYFAYTTDPTDIFFQKYCMHVIQLVHT